jgi:hypothetical protein
MPGGDASSVLEQAIAKVATTTAAAVENVRQVMRPPRKKKEPIMDTQGLAV